jgi:hypothetical protein
VAIGAPSDPVGTIDWGSCADGPFKGPGVHQKSHRQPMFSNGHPYLVNTWMVDRSRASVYRRDFFLETECYIYTETHQPIFFSPEDGGSM